MGKISFGRLANEDLREGDYIPGVGTVAYAELEPSWGDVTHYDKVLVVLDGEYGSRSRRSRLLDASDTFLGVERKVPSVVVGPDLAVSRVSDDTLRLDTPSGVVDVSESDLLTALRSL